MEGLILLLVLSCSARTIDTRTLELYSSALNELIGTQNGLILNLSTVVCMKKFSCYVGDTYFHNKYENVTNIRIKTKYRNFTLSLEEHITLCPLAWKGRANDISECFVNGLILTNRYVKDLCTNDEPPNRIHDSWLFSTYFFGVDEELGENVTANLLKILRDLKTGTCQKFISTLNQIGFTSPPARNVHFHSRHTIEQELPTCTHDKQSYAFINASTTEEELFQIVLSAFSIQNTLTYFRSSAWDSVCGQLIELKSFPSAMENQEQLVSFGIKVGSITTFSCIVTVEKSILYGNLISSNNSCYVQAPNMQSIEERYNFKILTFPQGILTKKYMLGLQLFSQDFSDYERVGVLKNAVFAYSFVNKSRQNSLGFLGSSVINASDCDLKLSSDKTIELFGTLTRNFAGLYYGCSTELSLQKVLVCRERVNSGLHQLKKGALFIKNTNKLIEYGPIHTGSILRITGLLPAEYIEFGITFKSATVDDEVIFQIHADIILQSVHISGQAVEQTTVNDNFPFQTAFVADVTFNRKVGVLSINDSAFCSFKFKNITLLSSIISVYVYGDVNILDIESIRILDSI